jgi:hypothetical protein
MVCLAVTHCQAHSCPGPWTDRELPCATSVRDALDKSPRRDTALRCSLKFWPLTARSVAILAEHAPVTQDRRLPALSTTLNCPGKLFRA